MSVERSEPAAHPSRKVRAASATAPELPDSPPRRIGTFALILALALVWRLAMAWLMPVITRDGVGFCWNARALGRSGLEALKSPEFNQHPLYAACILALHETGRLFGISESSASWQFCGQLVSLISGMLVVALSGVLAARVSRAIQAEASPQRVAAVAMLLAALLPLNIWLSVDVMSEQLFFVWYLSAATLLLGPWQPLRAGLFGLIVGLAFLTRPEGAALGLAGVMAVAARKFTQKETKSAACVALMAAGFLAIASPYWMALGKFSAKEDKQTIEELAPATAQLFGFAASNVQTGDEARPRFVRAAVTRERYPVHGAVGAAIMETVRAGRAVVLLAAIPALWVVRKKLAGPALAGLLAAASIHFTLTTILLYRHGYLSPRHTLAVVLLALPWAALTLEHLWRHGLRGNRVLGLLMVSLVFGVLAGYGLRVPNQYDAHLLKAAAWLNGRSDKQPDWVLVGGDSLKRAAFYADIQIRDWNEEAPDIEQRAASIVAKLRDERPVARFLGIETDGEAEPGDEPYGNDMLLKRLRQSPDIGPRLHMVFSTPRTNRGGLILYEFR